MLPSKAGASVRPSGVSAARRRKASRHSDDCGATTRQSRAGAITRTSHAPRLEWLAGSVADLLSPQSFPTCLSFYRVGGDGVSPMNGLGPTETCVTAQGGG